MRNLRVAIATLLLCGGLVLPQKIVSTAGISGTISSTRTITEDSELIGDVTCTVTGAPCISFGASGISLKLNGFSLTGQADPVTGCGGTAVPGEFGILVDRVRGAVIQGPGVVQNFRSHGIQIGAAGGGSTRVLVTLVTAATNCSSGILVFGPSSDNELEANTAVRNGNGGAPCGGIWLTSGSSRNRLRANRISGNGYAAQGNNFGIGVLGLGIDNEIVDNTVVGNTNGITLSPQGTGNLVRRNIVVGNPPVQISVNNPTTTGVDIRDNAPTNANQVIDNVCLTSVNAACSIPHDTRPPR